MALQRPVILMRPGEANNRLAGVLLKEGIECWRWPAFRIELPGKEDCDLVQERLDNLDDVEMVILPSPASVAAAAHWVKAWPEHITLARRSGRSSSTGGLLRACSSCAARPAANGCPSS